MNISVTNISFDASAKTLTFLDYAEDGVVLERIKLVVNATRNTIIMNMVDAGYGIDEVDGNIVTLEYDTASMNDTDKIYAVYDDPNGALRVILAGLITGEDFTDKVLGVTQKPVSGQIYTSSTYGQATTGVIKDFIKPAPGNLRSFYANRIDTSGLIWILFFNQTTIPATNATPLNAYRIPFPPAADATHPSEVKLGSDFFEGNGDWFTNGIAWALSVNRDLVDQTGITGTNFVIRAKFT